MQAQAERGRTDAPRRSLLRRPPWSRDLPVPGLILAVILFLGSLTAYIIDFVTHSGAVLDWYDLNVYNDAGLIARQLPSILYAWQLTVDVKFTYTPFAALVFAGGSYLRWVTLRWLMTVASLASIPLTAWLTLGGMGRRGVGRAAVALAVGAAALWTEPVTKALYLGQIEPLLLLLVVWDLTRPDSRRWKGIGIGLAAGIKLVPVLFIPYLLLAGKIRQAAVAAATVAATIVIGFIVLPGPSRFYWLTGYFIRPGRTGGVDSLVNQSLLAALARQVAGAPDAQPVWLPIAIVVALAGLAGGALLSRSGRPVQGWVLVGITSLLVSPISWDHHWVWIVPFIAMLAGIAMTSEDLLVRWGYLVAALGTVALFGSWPWNYTGPMAFIPSKGLLGWFVRSPAKYDISALHGWQLLTWNLFVAAGTLIYLAMLAAAWRTWRAPRNDPQLPERRLAQFRLAQFRLACCRRHADGAAAPDRPGCTPDR